MEEDIMDNIKMIKNMVKDNLYGLMVENMMAIGKMGNNMEEVLIIQLKDK